MNTQIPSYEYSRMNIPVDPLVRTTGSDEGIFIRTRLRKFRDDRHLVDRGHHTTLRGPY